MAHLSRRNVLKGGAALGGGFAVASFSDLFGFKRVFAQDGDDAQTILNLAATAETLACTHYYNVLTDSNIALTPVEIQFLRGALDSELQHLEFLAANGAQALTSSFYYPRNVYTDRDQFSEITEQAETAFVAAYLAATRRIAELGNPLLAATAAQVAVTEQVHLAFIRQIGGRIPNHVSLGQALFYNTSDVVPVLQGFLEGGEGFEESARNFPGADAIRDEIRDDGVLAIKPFTDPTLFAVEAAAAGSGICTVSPRGSTTVNIREGAGTDFAVIGALAAGQSLTADGQALDVSGVSWYRLADGGFVRADIVTTSGDCNVPGV